MSILSKSNAPLLAAMLMFTLTGCVPVVPPPEGSVEFATNFNDGLHGWRSGFADYPEGQDEIFEFTNEIAPIPDGLNADGQGLRIGGTNRSDDLFMFLTRQLTADDGVQPNTTYELSFRITVASNAPSGCIGIGGAPGESVYLKAGGAQTEPRSILTDGFFSMNVDKGIQSNDGPAASVASNIANGIACESIVDFDNAPYVSLTVDHMHDMPITADQNGNLWILIGTDSGFEGRTELFYQQVSVTLTATN